MLGGPASIPSRRPLNQRLPGRLELPDSIHTNLNRLTALAEPRPSSAIEGDGRRRASGE